MIVNVDRIKVMCEGQGHRSKTKVAVLINVIFKLTIVSKVTNKGSKQRQVGSHQHQVASLEILI